MDEMFCLISIRKSVADAAEARRLFDLIKEKINDVPEIELQGHATTHFNLEVPPE